MVSTNRIKPSGLIQATSHKQQAVGLDNSHDLGYYGNRTDGNARLAQLNASPSQTPGISGRQTHSKTDVSLLQEQSGRRHLPGVSPNTRFPSQAASLKPQASSLKRANDRFKPQATSLKLKATSYKLLDL